MTSNHRHSDISYIAACLRVEDIPHFLLIHHEKWNDWTLAGGHVESFELGNWAAAANRELEEELPPLSQGKDFILVPIFSSPLSWGPVPSKSADLMPTTYRAQFFFVQFLQHPSKLLAGLQPSKVGLFSQTSLEQQSPLSEPVRVLQNGLGGGLTSIPLAWAEGLLHRDFPAGLVHG